jgi:hypothetical protein
MEPASINVQGHVSQLYPPVVIRGARAHALMMIRHIV